MEALEAPYSTLDTEAELAQPRLIALLFADWATQSKGNKIILGGIFDELTLPADGSGSVSFYVYIRLTATAEEFVRIVLFAPDGQPKGDLSIDGRELIPTLERPNSVQLVTRFTLELALCGTWWFDVQYQGQSLGRVPLLVMSGGEASADAQARLALQGRLPAPGPRDWLRTVGIVPDDEVTREINAEAERIRKSR